MTTTDETYHDTLLLQQQQSLPFIARCPSPSPSPTQPSFNISKKSMDEDDPRHVELETLEAIYPEIRHPLGPDDPFTFEIELPVQPEDPVTVTFPAASAPSASADAGPSSASAAPAAVAAGPEKTDSLQVSYLPALSLRISLPEGYPADSPPVVRLSTNPQWLHRKTLAGLEQDGSRLWEEMGRDMVAYTYIDHLQRAAENVFGAITAQGTLEVDAEHKLAVLDHDIKAKKEAFERETFDCGVCLDPKKGSKCHKMLDCGHIFCLQCLQDFYNNAITEGDLGTVRCLAPNCAKERASAAAKDGKARKPKSWVSPSELLQIGLSDETVKRYVNLKYKTELESDKNTIYCPRSWCNGAARSKKHRKPDGLDFHEVSDAGSDHDEDGGGEDGKEKKKTDKGKKKNFDPADLLAICEDCGYAFCSRCEQSWHGEFVRCAPKRNRDELTEEEKASLEYFRLHTSPCPTCGAPAQKTHGCNHMICPRCDTHFCYLCSSWLDPGNPYRHYNQQENGKVTSCHMRLWELEQGDGDNIGLGFVGGNNAPAAAAAAAAAAPAEDDVDDEFFVLGDSEDENEPAARQPDPNPQGRRPAVDREAPLVLRLNVEARPAQDVQPEPHAAAGAGRGRSAPHRGRGNARGQAPAARGRGGRGGAAAGGGGRPQQAGRGRGRNVAPPRPLAEDERDGGAVEGAGAAAAALNPAQEAWVRNFVQLALLDAEDEVGGDSDDEEDDDWAIR